MPNGRDIASCQRQAARIALAVGFSASHLSIFNEVFDTTALNCDYNVLEQLDLE
jgi:hypothetical protein